MPATRPASYFPPSGRRMRFSVTAWQAGPRPAFDPCWIVRVRVGNVAGNDQPAAACRKWPQIGNEFLDVADRLAPSSPPVIRHADRCERILVGPLVRAAAIITNATPVPHASTSCDRRIHDASKIPPSRTKFCFSPGNLRSGSPANCVKLTMRDPRHFRAW